jgi:hypothetical protein
MPDSLRRYAPLLAILVYAIFAAWLTWPALGSLGTAIPGNEGDAFVHLWTYDWVKDALSSGQNPFFSDRLFYPQGVELYTHNFAWLNIALWLPLQALFGGSSAYTLVYLIVLVLNGSAVYFLVRHLTANEPASFLAGFIVSGWPYIITRFSQPNLIFIAFVPLALLAMHCLILSRRWVDVLWLGLAVAGIGLSRYQMLIMSAPLLLLAALYWLWQEDEAHRRPTFVQLAAAAGLAMLLLLPFAGPVIRFQATRDFAADILRDEAEWGEADLLGYFLPGEGAPLVGTMVAERFPKLLTHTPIGLVALGMAILGLFARRRDKWLWLSMALLLLLLALGRVLTINGETLMPLPYAWLEDNFFVVQLIRYPSRFSALLSIPVAVLAGYGMLVLSERLSTTATWAAVAGLAILIALGYRVPDYPLLALETPAWYESLAAEEGEFGLVTIPLTRTFDEFAMTYQLTHNKALVEGHVSRPPREAYDFLKSTPFLAGLRERSPVPPQNDDISGQLRPLAENNLPYLVIHKRFLTPQQASQWRRWMGIAPLHEDDELLVYPTALATGEDYRAQETAVPGLDYVAGQLTPNSLGIGDPLAGVTHWSLAPGTAREWTACYEIGDAEGAVVEEICQPLVFPAAEASGSQLARNAFLVALAQSPSQGTYQVSVRLLGKDGQDSGRLELGPLYVASEGRQFDAPKTDSPLAIDVGSNLALVGYDRPQLGNQSLDLTLFWQAKEEMDTSYKFYVHVFDANSGELAAQLDTVPRDWTYPTNVWHAGEYVSDRLSLPFSDVAPGSYRVEIGVYHPDTGERLPATDADGISFLNNSIPLAVVEIEATP